MRRYGWLVGAVGLCMLALGCADTAAVDTRDADVKAIKDLEAAWVRDIATKDVEKWVSYYAEDVAILLPNEPVISGRDKAREAIKPFLADPNFSVTFQPTRAEASKGGDLIYTVGTYTMTLSDPNKKPMTDKGKYVTVYKKQADGSWKAVADMINSDLPLPGSTPQ